MLASAVVATVLLDSTVLLVAGTVSVLEALRAFPSEAVESSALVATTSVEASTGASSACTWDVSGSDGSADAGSGTGGSASLPHLSALSKTAAWAVCTCSAGLPSNDDVRAQLRGSVQVSSDVHSGDAALLPSVGDAALPKSGAAVLGVVDPGGAGVLGVADPGGVTEPTGVAEPPRGLMLSAMLACSAGR